MSGARIRIGGRSRVTHMAGRTSAKLGGRMKLLWLDMEMTGLDPDKDVPLEVAVVVTQPQNEVPLAPVEQLEFVVRQPQALLDSMDSWCKETHGKSGLSAKVPHGTPLEEVDAELERFVRKHFPGERPVLAGNSIAQDRRFVRRYFPKLEALLHYRMLDVSSWKVVFEGLYARKFKKQNKHTALEDIRESISELSHYMEFVALSAVSGAKANSPKCLDEANGGGGAVSAQAVVKS